jgi:hypothetical protein
MEQQNSIISFPFLSFKNVLQASNNLVGSNSSSSSSLGLQNLLNNLLFFNQEGTDDAVTNAARATRSTVGTGNGFLVGGHAMELGGANSRNTIQGNTTITTLGGTNLLGSVDVSELVARSLDDLHAVGTGSIRILATIAQALHHFY